MYFGSLVAESPQSGVLTSENQIASLGTLSHPTTTLLWSEELTVNFDALLSFSEVVFADALVLSQVVQRHTFDGEPHADGVGWVYCFCLVSWTWKR